MGRTSTGFCYPLSRYWTEPLATQFLGEYEVPVDDKGRIFLPAELRRNLDPEAWIQTGAAIAITSAYVTDEGGTPTTLYLRNGPRICTRRAALAAYRRAAILNIALAD